MKAVMIVLFLALASFISGATVGTEEKVSLRLEHQAVLELCARNIPAETRKPAFGLCIYDNQLWESAMTDPPEKILTGGSIIIDGQKIELDVRGLALPWIDPHELTKRDCRLIKYDFGEHEYFYKLDVAFIKGGALDYVVTWDIYKNKSLRIKIEDLDDTLPDWME